MKCSWSGWLLSRKRSSLSIKCAHSLGSLLSTVLRPATTKGKKTGSKKGKISPYLITERRVPALIPVLGSQPAGDVSHKPGGRLPLLSTRPAVTSATLKRAAANFAAW